MKIHNLGDFVSSMAGRILCERVSTWQEQRKATKRKYHFCRIGRRKYFLGSDPDAAGHFRILVAAARIKSLGVNKSIPEIIKDYSGKGGSQSPVRKLHDGLLPMSGKHDDGRRVRKMRGFDQELMWKMEFQNFSREMLEARTWPGITENQWVHLRREIQSAIKRRARLGLPAMEIEPTHAANGFLKPIHPT